MANPRQGRRQQLRRSDRGRRRRRFDVPADNRGGRHRRLVVVVVVGWSKFAPNSIRHRQIPG